MSWRLSLLIASLWMAVNSGSAVADATIVGRSPEAGDPGTMSGKEPTGPVGPTPRDAAGHPDLTGYWKPLREKDKDRKSVV